jgi:uncharacterized membrane protein
MSTETLSATLRRAIVPALAINAVVLWFSRDQLAGLADARLHAPDWKLMLHAGWMIQLHTLAALSALLVALFLLRGAKGTKVHRVVGWVWVIFMMTTAISSFFVRELNPGRLSYVHIIAGWVTFATPLGVWAARTHRVKMHQRVMTGLIIGGLLIAGLLTFIPGRLMWRIFF